MKTQNQELYPHSHDPHDRDSGRNQRNSMPEDGIDRRNFLSCMAWAGTGLVWTMMGGVPTSKLFAATAEGSAGREKHAAESGFSFVQISDSHIGFNKAANQDVAGTLQAAIEKINRLPETPDLLLHTGDITHSSKPAEFDTAQEIVKGAKAGQVLYVPGEHDTASDDGQLYRERFGKDTSGSGWYSFHHKGVHFVGLNNVQQIDKMGNLGADQLAWLKNDLAGQQSSTPIVIFAHIPLWMVYPDWGWGTADGAEALSHLKRFGSVTVLNGHIHQVTQKVEGNVAFHTAMATAFPQPSPGAAQNPGPMVVPAEKLRSVLGISKVNFVARRSHLAIVDSSLADEA
ncbi:metallophosphoesterase family protein [Terracidiphilus gabretensis]|uniref:metallophosphoesterase family protein n=1 Tax=Terracidiphilus gabretensis TaxID=1577687 RepID=UPI000AA39481|nr:metallophosphoesterase [Terracidiphilus gabretensis]